MSNVNKKELEKDLSQASSLEAVALSSGGKIIIETLKSDVIGDMDTLANKYSELQHLDLIAVCADMKTKLDLLRVLIRAPKNKKFLMDIMKDALKEEEEQG